MGVVVAHYSLSVDNLVNATISMLVGAVLIFLCLLCAYGDLIQRAKRIATLFAVVSDEDLQVGGFAVCMYIFS